MARRALFVGRRLCLRPRACGGGARRHAVEQPDHVFDLGAVEALGDEHDLASPVGIRPAFEESKVVQQVLRALNHCRAIRLFGDVDQAFDPQQIRSEILLQRVEEKSQCLARNRLVAGKAERGNVAVVQVMMIVCVIIMAVRMRVSVFVALLVGGGIEPGANVAGFAAGGERVTAQDGADVDRPCVDARNFRCRIEPPQARRQRLLVRSSPWPDRRDRAW